MTPREDAQDQLAVLGLTDYEEQALFGLFELGRTTAPDLSEATGIPKARIYGVLDSLADDGYIEVIPARPKQYQPKSPDDVLDRAVENRRQAYESYQQSVAGQRDAFLGAFGPLYERGSDDVSPTEELFHVVDVGEPSETETQQLYREAATEVRVLTKSFEYFPSVRPAFVDAVERGIDVDVLFVHPEQLSPENQAVQRGRVEAVTGVSDAVSVRFSEQPLPWRGTVVDPSMDYDRGRAILLVEEPEVPRHRRQAAVTGNGSFVAGVNRFFELTWQHESVAEQPGA